MGDARRRGTHEDRVAQALQRKRAEAAAQRRRHEEHAAAHEARMQEDRRQTALAYATMTWWQLEMTEERDWVLEQYRGRNARARDSSLATLFAALYGMELDMRMRR